MAERPKKRTFGKNDAFFALSKKFTLTAIGEGEAPRGALVVEPAWDGQRVLATKVGDAVRIAGADYREWTKTFPVIAASLLKLAAKNVALDGVVCVFDEQGRPSFDALRTKVGHGTPVKAAVLICWDVLSIDDEDLRERPARERRARLAQLLNGAPAGLILSQLLDGTIDKILAAATALGIRSVVAREAEASYDGAWTCHGARVDWARALSPPPPLTNAAKVLYPRDGICKRDIVAYYRDVAPLLVAQLADRAVVVQRWPDGIDEFDWYQHRVPPRSPDYLRAAWVDGVRRIVIENIDALLWMVNQAGLTYHGFTSRLTSLATPDYAFIDLDPGERTTWFTELIDVAQAVRKLLELLELPSIVKTSGQRGLHILIPLAPGHAFTQAEDLARGIALTLQRLMPDMITLESEKEKRKGRLLVDHKQFLAKTLVVPYSLRGADGATVSTPLQWDEITPSLDIKAFTLRTLRDRLDAHGDLAAPMLAGTSELTRALSQLRR